MDDEDDALDLSPAPSGPTSESAHQPSYQHPSHSPDGRTRSASHSRSSRTSKDVGGDPVVAATASGDAGSEGGEGDVDRTTFISTYSTYSAHTGPGQGRTRLQSQDSVGGGGTTSGSVVDRGEHDQLRPGWEKNVRKHIFVLSSSGKPIFSKYGDEQEMVTTFGLLQAVVSIVQVIPNNTGDGVIVSDNWVMLPGLWRKYQMPEGWKAENRLFYQACAVLCVCKLNG
jgi:hypothetical protein